MKYSGQLNLCLNRSELMIYRTFSYLIPMQTNLDIKSLCEIKEMVLKTVNKSVCIVCASANSQSPVNSKSECYVFCRPYQPIKPI